MQIFSKNSELFLQSIKTKTRQILNQEMGLEFKRSRVHVNGYTYPIKFVVFEDDKRLGYFDFSTYQLGLNKKLMYLGKTQVIHNILRHELIHFYHGITGNKTHLPHGKEFKEICKKFHYGEEVWSPYANLENLNNEIEGDLKSEQVIIKIKKLFSLANSDNQYESKAATIKANELLLKYNLQRFNINLSEQEEEEVCLKRVLEAKKSSTKLKAIYEILETFFVQPVINHGKGFVYLEVIGTRVNVELADYIASFLDHEFERLWLATKKSNPEVKGLKAKNSFYKGISKGYVLNIKEQISNKSSKNQLVQIQRNIEKQVALVYGRLSYSRINPQTGCSNSLQLGKEAGKNLRLRKGLESNSKSKRLITIG